MIFVEFFFYLNAKVSNEQWIKVGCKSLLYGVQGGWWGRKVKFNDHDKEYFSEFSSSWN